MGAAGAKRLCLSKDDKVICGLCGGLGKYFNVDPNIIRLAWIALAVIQPLFIIVYLLACLVLPREVGEGVCSNPKPFETSGAEVLLVIGLVLIMLGLPIMSLAFIPSWSWPLEIPRIYEPRALLVGLIVMALGIALIIKSLKRL